MKNRVFISYSHKDLHWLEELQTHLKPLERAGIVSRWDDTLIRSGAEWRKEIRQALAESRIAVLLVSKHFLASDFIANDELPPLLAASQRDGAIILPVIVGPCRFDRTPGLAQYQAVNDPRRTLLEMTEAERDRVWLEITYSIEDRLREALAQESPSLPLERALELAPQSEALRSPRVTVAEAEIPELYLLVRTTISDGNTALSFQLKAQDSSLELNDALFGPVVLRSEPRTYFAEFFREIENLRTSSEEESKVALRKLDAKGSALFSTVLPDGLAKVLWDLQNKVHSLVIVSDEGVVPWELFKLTRKDSRGIQIGPYLCEAFSITRWPSGFAFHRRLPLRNIALIQAPLLSSQSQANLAQLLCTPGKHTVTSIQPRFLDVYDALSSGTYDGIHFSTHGATTSTGQIPKWRLFLDDRTDLSPEDLLGQAGNLSLSHPLVFLNACHTGLNADTLTRISGWAIEFIRAGAGAFIGSYWSLHGDAATVFEEEFYKNFLSGVPFGDSVRRARLVVRSAVPGPSWLAYAAYGHPSATIHENSLSDQPSLSSAQPSH